MAKGGKLTKLMKKLSFTKTSQTNTSSLDSSTSSSSSSSSSNDENNSRGRHAVYVGKCRRQYLVPFEVIEHPIFRQLAGKCTGAGEITVGCEVVLFDHLLWMLENGDHETELSSLDELVGYYAC